MAQQRRCGLIGGMSWESTVLYYQHINRIIGQRLGGLHSADLLIHSVDFEPIAHLQHAHNWAALGEQLALRASALELAGAQGLAIATNTMHYVAPAIVEKIAIPLLHIGDAAASACRKQQVSKVGLLGTRFTMEQAFYRERLQAGGLTVLTPALPARQQLHDIIYQELCQGKVREASKAVCLNMIQRLHEQGADAILLGCTEIGMLVKPADTQVTVLDTTTIHAEAIAEWMLAGGAA